MVGYTQAITDSSYNGQILCQTFPLIGNYGVAKEEFESDGPKIEGYVVFEVCKKPSHYTSKSSVGDWLKDTKVPGIEGIDTRELTKTLRMEGTMMGVLEVSHSPINTADLLYIAKHAQPTDKNDLVSEVTVKEPVTYSGIGKRVVVIDCGVKHNIIRSLQKREVHVTVVPASYDAESIMSLNPDGILISNGPGDPKKVDYVISTVKELISKEIPILGICLGNQILGLALGCDTYKMKFGHRGQNHPIMDTRTKKCFITSQNHGYAIDPESVKDSEIEISCINVNDGTVEGIRHNTLPIIGVQYHPEASPGPTDTNFIFDIFLNKLGGKDA